MQVIDSFIIIDELNILDALNISVLIQVDSSELTINKFTA